MNNRKSFLLSLLRIAEQKCESATAPASSKAFRRALLDFGSETDDNRACATEITVSTVRDGGRRVSGLALKRQRKLVSQILNDAEGTPVPARVRRRHAGITQQEWDAVLRLATLVFISLERDR